MESSISDPRSESGSTTSEAPCLDGEIPGAVNLRDVGGIRVGSTIIRRGLLYRSGITHQLAPDGLARLRSQLDVRTVIDLRSDAELRHDGVAPFAEHGIAHRRIAIYGVTAVTPGQQHDRFHQMASGEYDWCARYQTLVIEHAPSFVAFFEAITEPGALPAVFHCSAGRDRTGVAAALLLSLLGVPDEIIAQDYARTGALLMPHLHRYARMRDSMGLDDAKMAALLQTEADVMRRFMSWLQDTQGGSVGLLTKAGLPEARLELLRRQLLEA
jgi:protein-tyrosine phosphatase